MAAVVFMYVSMLVFGVYIRGVTGQTCGEREWFGPSCNFQCHCLDRCNMTTGECTSDRGCDVGYFGPFCQYYSVAFEQRTEQDSSDRDASFAVDSNESTCSSTGLIFFPKWTVTFANPTWLTWIDVVFPVNRDSNSEEIDIYAVNGNDQPYLCNASKVWISPRMMRITCKDTYNATSLSIISASSERVRLQLCEVYVYGGRNLAVHKRTNQSSEFAIRNRIYGSSLAVDGDASTDFDKNSCAHTSDRAVFCLPGGVTKDPWWRVYLDANYLLYRVVVFNRGEQRWRNRLQDFRLKVSNGQQDVYSPIYRDRANPVKEVTSIQMPANQTAFSLELRLSGDCRILTLCEVQLFGDCLDLRYGLECNQTCTCRDPREVCNKIDGSCVSGCVDGITGTDCKHECQNGTFGRNCVGVCSSNCLDGTCHAEHGTCECIPGWKGDNCTTPCDPGTYGPGCTERCGKCKEKSCFPANRTCIQGCEDGWMGSQCTACDREHYGADCIGVCSSRHCEGRTTCSPSTGQCDGGCEAGWTGTDCTEQLTSDGAAVHVAAGAGTAVFVVIVVVIVAVLVWRRSGRNLKHPDHVYYNTASRRDRITDGTQGVVDNQSSPTRNDSRTDANPEDTATDSTYTTIDPLHIDDHGHRESKDEGGYEVPVMGRTYEKLNTTTRDPDTVDVYTGLESGYENTK